MKLILLLCCFIFCKSFYPVQAEEEKPKTKTKKELISEVKRNMSSQLRPVKVADNVVNITLNLAIQHIENIDEKQQTMTIQGFLPLSWHSETVGWNRSEYVQDVPKLMISAFYPWKPNMQVWNSGKGNDPWKYGWSLPAHIYADGTVYISRYCTFTVTCAFDFTWYPYDVQTCPIALSSFEHPLTEVDINFWSSKPWLRTYWPDSKQRTAISGWQIKDKELSHEKLYWTVDGITTNLSKVANTKKARSMVYPIAKFSITIQRHYPYFGIILVLPCFITAFFTLLSFWIKNVRMAVFVLFANLVLIVICLLDLVQVIAPSSGGVPKIVHFYGFNLACTSISVLFRLIAFIITYNEETDEDEGKRVVSGEKKGSTNKESTNKSSPKAANKIISQSALGTKLFNRMPDYELSFENDLYQPFSLPDAALKGVGSSEGFDDNFNPRNERTTDDGNFIENEEQPDSVDAPETSNKVAEDGAGFIGLIDAIRFGLFFFFLISYLLCVIVLLVV